MIKPTKKLLFFLCIMGLGIFLGRARLTGRASQNKLVFLPFAQRNIASWIGPDGGSVVGLAVNPVNPEIVYAGTWGAGVYKSTDGGSTWQASSQGLGNLFINSIAIDSQHPEIVFAGTYKSGIYRSSDAGSSWISTNTGIQEQAIVYSIAVHPVNSNLVYAATRGVSNDGSNPWNGVLYASKDGGLSWNPSLYNVGGETQQDWVYSIDIGKTSQNPIFAATHQYGIFRSNDSGASWERVINGLDDWSSRAVVSDPVNGIIYTGFWHTGGVYSSKDQGDHWALANPAIGGKKIYTMAIDPLQPKTIFLGTFNDGLLRTVDGFNHFDIVGPQGDKFYTVIVNPKNDQAVLCGTQGDGVWASPDNGDTWKPSSSGMKTTSAVSILFNEGQIYTGVFGEGVLSMPITGTIWTQSDLNLTDRFLNGLVQDPAHPSVLFALTDSSGLFKKDMNTSSGWIYTGINLPPAQAISPQPLSVLSHFPNYPGLDDISALEADSPSTTQMDSLFAMAIAPSNPNMMYLGLENSGLYASQDGGASWNPTELLMQTISTLAVDPRDEKKVYAAGSDKNIVYVSSDGGRNWNHTSLPVPSVNRIALSPVNPDLLYAGTSSGLYRIDMSSTEGWSLVRLNTESVISIAFYPGNPAHILAGTENGVYQSYDNGANWIAAPVDLQGISVQTIIFDPDHPSNAYFGTKARGILRISIY